MDFWRVLLLLLLFSCSQGPEKKEGASVKATQHAVAPFAADSLDILYFTKPFEDSSRYTRYFSAVKLHDSSFEASLENALKGTAALLEKPRPCLSEGKIIIPKGGDSFKVLYFSRIGGKSCTYIYEIREGLFRYYELDEKLAAALNQFEKSARKVE